MVYMSSKAIAYLQLTSLESFIDELKRRGLYEARLSEWVQRREMFEMRKFRLTALDPYHGLIIRYETTYYQGLAEPEPEQRKRLRDEARKQLVDKLEAEGISILEGEYHAGKAEW
jgi:hypothetical protein